MSAPMHARRGRGTGGKWAWRVIWTTTATMMMKMVLLMWMRMNDGERLMMMMLSSTIMIFLVVVVVGATATTIGDRRTICRLNSNSRVENGRGGRRSRR